MDLADRLFAYEAGELESEEEMVELFQDLIESGWIYHLQGSYQRTAITLDDAGLIG